MKILVILLSHEMNIEYIKNITIFDEYVRHPDNQVDYCGISNTDDFINYESIISFKYKMINAKRQLSKVCDFITAMNGTLDYDLYIKMRPDFLLLEPINFSDMKHNAINARARVYRGPKRIKYGMSINGKGRYHNIGCCYYDDIEKEVILDDCIYIFNQNVINMGAFNTVETDNLENEWFHTHIWNNRGIDLNVIGINTIRLKCDLEPGSINCI